MTMIEISAEKLAEILFIQGAFMLVFGILIVAIILVIVQYQRMRALREYLYNVGDVVETMKDIKSLETNLEVLVKKTNLPIFKSQYNELLRVLTYLKRKWNG